MISECIVYLSFVIRTKYTYEPIFRQWFEPTYLSTVIIHSHLSDVQVFADSTQQLDKPAKTYYYKGTAYLYNRCDVLSRNPIGTDIGCQSDFCVCLSCSVMSSVREWFSHYCRGVNLMIRTIAGFATIGVAIFLMLAPNLFQLDSNWPFLLGLWVGVLGLALINSRARREEYKRKKQIREQLKKEMEEEQESQDEKDENNENDDEQETEHQN